MPFGLWSVACFILFLALAAVFLLVKALWSKSDKHRRR